MPISIGTFLKDESGDEFVVTNVELFLHDGSPISLQAFIYCRGIMADDGSEGTMGQVRCLTPEQINQGIWEVMEDKECLEKLKSG